MSKILAIFMTLCLASQLFAHRVLIMIDDNADGTVYIETGLSSGGSAAGAKLFLTDRATGRPLYQGVVPDSGNITIPRPNVPYSVSLSMGDGHTITQKGPELLPIEEKKESEEETPVLTTESEEESETTEK